MSYNTRRTGAATGRQGQTTQVNYHQQPSRPVGNATIQSRNPGYTTQQGYSTSAAQPGYTTQQATSTAQPGYTSQPATYTTQPPLPAQQQTKPQSQPATPVQNQPPLPAQQPPLPKQPTTPNLKQEPVTPADTPKMDTTENGGTEAPAKVPFWKKRPFTKLSNKVRKQRQNAKLRKVLNPKNALTFLNELRPGIVKFVVREESGWGGFVATVDIDGKSFSGHGMSVSKAKLQASEQALKHLLLEQLSKSQSAAPASENKEDTKQEEEEESMEADGTDESGESKAKKPRIAQPEDDLPWGSLAAYALHKLFDEWQKEGTDVPQGGSLEKYEDEMEEEAYFPRRPIAPPEYGFPPGPRRFAPAPGPFGPGRGRGFGPYPPRGPPLPQFGVPPRRPPPPSASSLNSRPALPLERALGSMMPMKKIPDDANQRHPVMLLNQLKPNVIYNESREGDPPRVNFIISVTIDGKDYIGRGKNKKEAKKAAAKAALAPLGIIYREDGLN